MKTNVALIQMCSGPDVAANLETANALVADAASAGAQLVVLPENFGLMPASDRDRLNAAESAGSGAMQTFLSATAREHDLWLVGGTIPMATSDAKRVRSACLAYDERGKLVARYDKIHLFDVTISESESYRESATIEAAPAESLVTVNSPAGCIGLTICYDLRFPELYRGLSRRGATLYTVPSAFTAVTGRAHWETLLRARAIENQAYVLAPGQWGRHANGRDTYGHSMIIGPWGEILGQRPDGDGVVLAEIDSETIAAIRARFPSLEHRRLV